MKEISKNETPKSNKIIKLSAKYLLKAVMSLFYITANCLNSPIQLNKKRKRKTKKLRLKKDIQRNLEK